MGDCGEPRRATAGVRVYRESMTAGQVGDRTAGGPAPARQPPEGAAPAGPPTSAPTGSPVTRPVARHVVALKVRLLVNALTRSIWQMLALVLSFVYGLGMVGLLLLALGAVARRDPALATAWVTVGGSLLVGAWWVVPLVAFGVDSTVSVERLRQFGLRRRDLVLGLGAAGLVGAPGVLTVLLVGGSTVVWRESPGALVVAVPAAVVAVATCVVGSRTWTALLAPSRSSRRFRDSGVFVLLVLVALAVPLAGWLLPGTAVTVQVERLAEVAGWTPLGAAWAVPAAVATGDLAAAAGRAAIAVVVLALLVGLWVHALDRAAVGPAPSTARRSAPHRSAPHRSALHRSALHRSASRGTSRRRARGLLGAPGVLGIPVERLLDRVLGVQTSAVTARCLTYWRRDPRYLGALAVVPFLPLVLALLDRGDGSLVLVACPLAAFLVGWTISADVAYDHTAFWAHLSAGLPGRADRVGRAVAATLVGLPVTAAVVVGVVWSTGRWHDLPAVAGISGGIVLTALGISSVVSARFVYPVPRPGDGPFSSPQGSAVADLATQAGGWAVLALLALPETAVGIVAVVSGSAALGWLALGLGVVLGVFWWVAGVRIGAAVNDHRAPELLQQVVAIR